MRLGRKDPETSAGHLRTIGDALGKRNTADALIAALAEQSRLNYEFESAESRFRMMGHISSVGAYRGGAELRYRAHRALNGSIIADKPLPREVEDWFTGMVFALARNKDLVDSLDEEFFGKKEEDD